MPVNIKDIRLQVRNLLRTNWNNAEMVESLDDDDIHTGWWDEGKDNPQVTVSHPEESPLQGGDSGVTGLKGDGTGYVQHINGTITVNCWGGSREDYANRGEAEVQTQAMADEVERIIYQNIHALQEVSSITVSQRLKITEDEEVPTEHRVQFQLKYNWTRE